MKFKYIERNFSELAPGDVYLDSPDSNYPCIKIKPILDKSDKLITAIRLDDGECMFPRETSVVYPLNCFISRN